MARSDSIATGERPDVALVLDTGGLIAYQRADRMTALLIDAATRRGQPIVTSSGCVAQAWRQGGPRHARLARLLRGVVEHGITADISRSLGGLCGRSGTADVVDAHVASITGDGDVVATSDDGDLRLLFTTIGRRAEIVHC